jgi:hypothetical protein
VDKCQLSFHQSNIYTFSNIVHANIYVCRILGDSDLHAGSGSPVLDLLLAPQCTGGSVAAIALVSVLGVSVLPQSFYSTIESLGNLALGDVRNLNASCVAYQGVNFAGGGWAFVGCTLEASLCIAQLLPMKFRALHASLCTSNGPISVIFGPLNVTSTVPLSVTGNLTFSSAATTTITGIAATSMIQVASMVKLSGALVVSITAAQPMGFVLEVVQASLLSGEFASVSVLSSESCNPYSAFPAVYSSTSMSIAFQVTSTCSSLSTGAIFGIAVGVAVCGILLAIGIVVLIRYRIQKWTEREQREIAGRNGKVNNQSQMDVRLQYLP